MTVRLIHVGTHESSARRFMTDDDVPDWVGSGTRGGEFGFRQWAEDQAMVTLTARMAGEQHAVVVTIAGLYEFVEEDAVPGNEETVRNFYGEHMAELLPFLRQAVHAASSQVWPVQPILLDTLAWSAEEAAARR